MTWFEQVLSSLGVAGGLGGLLTYLLGHASGLIPALRKLVAVLDGGTISVQQVVAEAEKLDPKLYAELQAKVAQYEADAKTFEVRVQKEAAQRLSDLVARLGQSGAAPAAEVPAPEPPDPAAPAV